MIAALDTTMYHLGQLFLAPVLCAIALLFAYACVSLGAFLWQSGQRRARRGAGFELVQAWRAAPQLSQADLELIALQRLDTARIATRVAPMLGLVATMIPMGPALRALGNGQLADVSQALAIAFSAVILALIAASVTYTVLNVRRRWYAADLAQIERLRREAP
ncbi:MotA/TolQ/ExbB proton channel family protein [Nitrogeniibacter mangrovi]|uniref:MotA/TolQ/ExbB proton channel family protein n=1 Tax=Nitrogeniibacter mangrovi TaxID=2016596 RepID=A0A6C1B676_9RHOO|nr:MotA/TolQ/ExbB proton channel family protein [Nitrogeniibacter mangrovi]QID19236.1 MotA/TolQ/ExbB proton channel family protein [Nitrogeniibacter mangrovi]